MNNEAKSRLAAFMVAVSRVAICCIAIGGCAAIALLVSAVFSNGRQSGAPVVLFVPLALGILGFTIQRKLRWGVPIAIWTLVIVEPVIFVAVAHFGEYEWDGELSPSLVGYVATITAILGVPWIIGTFVGRKELREKNDNA